MVSKGVGLIKRQPIKGTVACKVTVIRFSGVIIKHCAGERLNNHHTSWHHHTLPHEREKWLAVQGRFDSLVLETEI